MLRQRFNSYAELAGAKEEGADYTVSVRPVAGSNVAILAPHGGTIETHTSVLAGKIANDDHSLYLFEGLDRVNPFFELHVESHKFDEPRCLALVKTCETVITVHGCMEKSPVVYIGGLDEGLKSELCAAFNAAGVLAAQDGHPYPGRSPDNICNRGITGAGVQLEFSKGIREDERLLEKCARIVRTCIEDKRNMP